MAKAAACKAVTHRNAVGSTPTLPTKIANRRACEGSFCVGRVNMPYKIKPHGRGWRGMCEVKQCSIKTKRADGSAPKTVSAVIETERPAKPIKKEAEQ